MLTEKEQKFLLQLARNAIGNFEKMPSKMAFFQHFKDKKGVFVSLYIDNQLRGCIGHLLPYKTVYESVVENAVNAAYNDYRFPPLTRKEFDSLKIEISLLTDPVRLDYIDAEHLLEKLDVNEGVILKKGLKMATFLPQVWECFADKNEFLRHLCIKANLNRDAWKDSNAELYVYKAEKFKEL